ncbi:MAG: hypothetical protein GXX86_05925 [Propionibacterium sp.]|nr:hypothetical protein [Propionibacterium sp.]
MRWNPPPNWPAPPPGWEPPSGWQPDPSWGPPPPGWQLWVDDAPQHSASAPEYQGPYQSQPFPDQQSGGPQYSAQPGGPGMYSGQPGDTGTYSGQPTGPGMYSGQQPGGPGMQYPGQPGEYQGGEAPAKKKPMVAIIAVVAAIVLIGGIVAGVLLLGDDDEPTTGTTPAPTVTDPEPTDVPDPASAEPEPAPTTEPAEPTDPETSAPPEGPTGEGSIGEGVHEVGTDVQPGTYRSSEDAEATDYCYWARLSALDDEFESIIANGSRAPAIVTIAESDVGFEVNGCGEFVPVAETYPDAPATSFGEGVYEVGKHIEPGTYKAAGAEDMSTCYWARLSGFGGVGIDDVIDNDMGNDTVVIEEGDVGFENGRCGTWTKQ